MSGETRVDVSQLIDSRPLDAFRIRTIALCGVVALLDGFDTQAIAFVATAVAADWGLSVAAFGPVFGVGLFGLMLGALIFGPVADRYGRKNVILFATAWFGAFALLTASAESMSTLLIYRFLTGIGLGAALPNVIAMTAEYAPKRSCTTLVTIMFCGFPLGAVLGGLVSAQLIPAYGWPSVFILGGLLPLVLVPVLMAWLPESIRFLVGRGTEPERIAKICNRVGATTEYGAAHRYVMPEEKLLGLPIKHLFRDGRALGTSALRLVFFSNLLLLYFLVNWLPSVLQRAGLPLEQAIIGTVVLNLGGIIGGLVQSRIIDRIGPFGVLTVTYAAAIVLVALIGQVGTSVAGLMAAILGAGFCVLGAQFGINALAATYYPTSIRSTGVGWALGIGRIGSILGPVIGGTVISLQWSTEKIFLVSAIPALVSAIGVYAIGALARLERSRAAAAGAADRASLEQVS